MEKLKSSLLQTKFILVSIYFICNSYPSFSNEKLIISSIPDESLSELSTKFKPLVDYLEKELSIDIEFVPVTDYSAVVEALVNEKVHLAWLGGFTFVQASIRSNNNIIPIIQRKKDQKFRSVFITHKSSSINNINELKNKNFSFGSPSSTSGHLMPRYFLMKQGIEVDTFFKRIAYSGAHDATIFSVLSRKVDGGVLNELVWEKFKQNNKKLTEKLKVVSKTKPYFDYNWSILKSVDKTLREKLINAFLKLSKENDFERNILQLQRAENFIPTYKKNYEKIKTIAIDTGLIELN